MVPVASDDRETIHAAAELIRERSQDVERVWAPSDWREIDLEYSGQVVVRLRPAGCDATDVEVFSYGALIGAECLRKYHARDRAAARRLQRSADRLAEMIEDVRRRAIESRDIA